MCKAVKIIIISDTHNLKCQNKILPLKSHIQTCETTINLYRPSFKKTHTLLLILPFYTVSLGFYIDIFSIQHFKNYKVFYSQGYSSHFRYTHTNCKVSVPYKLCIHILLFLSSTWWWPFRPKHVVESNRINCWVLTGFIAIISLLSYIGMKFVLSTWHSRNMLKTFGKRLLKAIFLAKHK